jgi:hypothetical protein
MNPVMNNAGPQNDASVQSAPMAPHILRQIAPMAATALLGPGGGLLARLFGLGASNAQGPGIGQGGAMGQGGIQGILGALSGGSHMTTSPVNANWTQPSLFNSNGSINPSGGNQYAYNSTGPGQGTYFVPTNPNNPNGPGTSFPYGGIGSYAGTSDNRFGS